MPVYELIPLATIQITKLFENTNGNTIVQKLDFLKSGERVISVSECWEEV